MEPISSIDGGFIVYPSRETITPEEIPRIISRIGSIIIHAANAYTKAIAGDIRGTAEELVLIYEDILAIKKMIED